MQVDIITYQLWCTVVVLMVCGVSWSRGPLPLTAAATSRSVSGSESRLGLSGIVLEQDSSYSVNRDHYQECNSGCENSHEQRSSYTSPAYKWTMPLVSLGDKQYYLGIFFKGNWYKAYQFCRFHGLHLVSIESQEENTKLEEFIKAQGLFNEHFWTSGTDQGDEGKFFWMGTGRPISFTNWNAGEPNNFRYENGEEEHCLELWNRDGKGLKWNDTPCSFETYFLCERQD